MDRDELIRELGRIARLGHSGWHGTMRFENSARAVVEELELRGWSPPMSEANAAAYAEGEFWRIMEDQYREVLDEPDV